MTARSALGISKPPRENFSSPMVPRGRLEAGAHSPKNGWRPLDSGLHYLWVWDFVKTRG
jgi:hypothetical protein